MLMNY